jgi:hypothetical protein
VNCPENQISRRLKTSTPFTNTGPPLQQFQELMLWPGASQPLSWPLIGQDWTLCISFSKVSA